MSVGAGPPLRDQPMAPEGKYHVHLRVVRLIRDAPLAAKKTARGRKRASSAPALLRLQRLDKVLETIEKSSRLGNGVVGHRQIRRPFVQ